MNLANMGLKHAKPMTDFNSSLVLLLAVSIFLPFYITMAVIFLIAMMALFNYKKRAEAFKAPYSKFIICVMLGEFLVAAVYSNHLGMVYALAIAAVLIAGFYVRSIMTRQLFNTMLDVACLSSIACAIIAIFQKLSVYSARPSYRPVSTFTNANYYGMMIEFIVLIACYRLLTNAGNKKFYFAVIGVNIIGLYLSASMSSFIGMSCGVLVLLYLKGRHKMATFMLLMAVAFIVFSFFLPRFFPRIGDVDQTMGQRLQVWIASIKGIELHPLFGQGPVTYQLIYNEFDGFKTFHCHNLLLDVILNYGFVGASAIAFYVVTQFKVLRTRLKNNICSNMNILMVAVVVATAVHGLTDVTIFWMQTGMLFMLLFSSTGIGSAYASKNSHIPQGMPLLPGYANRVGAHATYSKN
ncbi:MAG TPA: O-antigen ligase family protein [Oscillospiraceae bacterium]|nr:O-antigen ligase family protein [Oscillospiraceae bacterium]